jgi:N-acylneuraminate cytidylyltransferase
MKNIAIIPARGGSKRIPKKNIKNFLGKPIIAYSIEAAINSGLFDDVIVSTDSEEIAEIAKKYGASVPFLRSEKNSDDFASTIDVIDEVIEELSKRNQTYKNCCCIYPTAPFLNANKLNEAFTLLIENSYDVVFPVIQFSFPIQRAVKRDENGKISMFTPEFLTSRSQDLEASYHDSGQFYFFDIQQVLTQRKLWTSNTGCIVISELEGQDIDNLDDWKLAELKYQMIHKEN